MWPMSLLQLQCRWSKSQNKNPPVFLKPHVISTFVALQYDQHPVAPAPEKMGECKNIFNSHPTPTTDPKHCLWPVLTYCTKTNFVTCVATFGTPVNMHSTEWTSIEGPTRCWHEIVKSSFQSCSLWLRLWGLGCVLREAGASPTWFWFLTMLNLTLLQPTRLKIQRKCFHSTQREEKEGAHHKYHTHLGQP